MFNFCKNILFKDSNLIVMNKPAGIAVHKGLGSGPSLEPILAELAFGLPNPPQLAHRLDAATSGCLVLGRHRRALSHLGALFQSGKIDKVYRAVVEGLPLEEEGMIDFPLAKQTLQKHRWWMKVDPKGMEAKTKYKVLKRFANFTLLELIPITGRTHQLRVHCKAMGFPIFGDQIYGNKSNKNNQNYLHLHAFSISIPYHFKKPSIEVEAPLPDHMQNTLERLLED